MLISGEADGASTWSFTQRVLCVDETSPVGEETAGRVAQAADPDRPQQKSRDLRPKTSADGTGSRWNGSRPGPHLSSAKGNGTALRTAAEVQGHHKLRAFAAGDAELVESELHGRGSRDRVR